MSNNIFTLQRKFYGLYCLKRASSEHGFCSNITFMIDESSKGLLLFKNVNQCKICKKFYFFDNRSYKKYDY